MAHEINIVLLETGLTLKSKIWAGSVQTGSDITMTENVNRLGHYYGDAPATIANGIYVIIVETSGGVIKGSSEAQFIDNVMQTGNLTKMDEIWKIGGLDSANPMTATADARTAGAVDLAVTGYGTATTIVTRQ